MTNKMKKVLAALGLLACALGANASNWVELGTTKDLSVLVDKSSVRNSGPSERTAWFLFKFPKPRSGDAGEGRLYQSYKTLRAFSCSEKTVTIKSTTFYSGPAGDGESVRTDTYSTSQTSYIVPDPVGEVTWNAVCE